MSNSSILGPARNHVCARCGRRAASWQHRVSKGRSGPTDLFNCVPLCGSGTTGCHGWAEHNIIMARKVWLDVPGSFTRGRYTGPDPYYRAHYNSERWDDVHGWIVTDEPIGLPFGTGVGPSETWR